MAQRLADSPPREPGRRATDHYYYVLYAATSAIFPKPVFTSSVKPHVAAAINKQTIRKPHEASTYMYVLLIYVCLLVLNTLKDVQVSFDCMIQCHVLL